MRRRDLIVLLAGAAAIIPEAGAHSADRVRRIGYFTTATGAPDEPLGVLETRALVEGLRELGWADGRNVTIDHRFSGYGHERIVANGPGNSSR